MRKLSELSQEEFFDVLFELAPILPLISQLNVVKTGFAFVTNYEPTAEDVKKIKENIKNRTKTKLSDEDIAKNLRDNAKRSAEFFTLLAQEIPIILPFLTSSENRPAIRKVLSILEQVPVEEVSAWSPPKLINRIVRLVSDSGFRDFLDYREHTATGELSE